MSVKATTTVSVAPASTSARNCSKLSMRRILFRPENRRYSGASGTLADQSVACLDNSLADAGEYATGSTASEAMAGRFFNQGGGISETPAQAPGPMHTSEDEQ